MIFLSSFIHLMMIMISTREHTAKDKMLVNCGWTLTHSFIHSSCCLWATGSRVTDWDWTGLEWDRASPHLIGIQHSNNFRFIPNVTIVRRNICHPYAWLDDKGTCGKWESNIFMWRRCGMLLLLIAPEYIIIKWEKKKSENDDGNRTIWRSTVVLHHRPNPI